MLTHGLNMARPTNSILSQIDINWSGTIMTVMLTLAWARRNKIDPIILIQMMRDL